MKKTGIFFVLIFVLCSCTTTYYFQVFESKPNEAIIKENKLFYESNTLTLTYDFWDDGGRMIFRIYNKSDNPIYINLDRSHLIVNGHSYDYYTEKEKITTKKSTTSVYKGFGVSRGFLSGISVTSKMKKIVQIPPKSYINVGNLSIYPFRYEDCDLKKYPGIKKLSTKIFDNNNTPLKFKNYITIDTSDTFNNPTVLENSFFVEIITNMRERDFRGKSEFIKICEEEKYIYPYSYSKPQNFYKKYGGLSGCMFF